MVEEFTKNPINDIVYIDEEMEQINLNVHNDIATMSFMMWQVSRMFELANEFKKRGTYLVCGGMHLTNSPDDIIEYFDTVFVGEGEKT